MEWDVRPIRDRVPHARLAAEHTSRERRARGGGKATLVASSAPTPRLWNRLALVSVLLSLVFPVGVIVLQLAGGVFQPVNASTPSAYYVGNALLLASILTVPLALATGHGALDGATRRAYQQPLRGVAIVGLVLAYGSIVTFLGGIVLAYWILTHTRWHLVG